VEGQDFFWGGRGTGLLKVKNVCKAIFAGYMQGLGN
jgi:hypothetical protein